MLATYGSGGGSANWWLVIPGRREAANPEL
jgi:hypothetical protein